MSAPHSSLHRLLLLAGRVALPFIVVGSSACGGGGGGGGSGGGTGTGGATLASIALSAGTTQVAAGSVDPITVTATYSDGSTKDVTSASTVTASDGTVLTVQADTSGTVSASANRVGTATLQATYHGMAASLTLAVKAQLPLEVFGGSGARSSLFVNIADPSVVTQLYIRCHACGYGDKFLDGDVTKNKATLILPSGRAVQLKYYSGGRLSGTDEGQLSASGIADVHDPDVTVMEPELSYGGVGGGFHTVRLHVTLKPGDLAAGNNTFTFQYTDADQTSVGFRIVEFNLVSGNGSKLLSDTALGIDDPAAWTPPSTTSTDIAAGQALWHANGVLKDPYFAALAGTAPDAFISASCADCHTASGSDLHYFQYSNAAIIARARFHGLSASQGAQIASYIRQLDAPAPASARPWNPPYQPGPGIDARPVQEWAAGAGIGAVLDRDSDIRKALFPNGTSDAAVAAVVDRFGTLNMRELPVALQLPDWNAWLPRVHPKDLFNAHKLPVRSPYGASPPAGKSNADVGELYPQWAYEQLAALPPASMSAGVDTFISAVNTWVSSGANCFTQTAENGPPMRAIDSDVLMTGLTFGTVPTVAGANCAIHRHDYATTGAIEEAKRGLAAWMSVKQWEIIHGNNLEAVSQNRAPIRVPAVDPKPALDPRYKPAPRMVDPSEHFGWGQTIGGGSGGVFMRAPHFLGYNAEYFHDKDPLVSRYETTTWYHAQLVINPGYRTSQPSHFPYTLLYITNTGNDQRLANPGSPRLESFRYWASMIKMRQLQTNGYYGQEVGLDLRDAQPFFYYSDNQGNTQVVGGVDPAGAAPTLWRSLVRASLLDMLADASNAAEADWRSARQNSVVETSDAGLYPGSSFSDMCVPCFPGPSKAGGSGAPFASPGAVQGLNTLRLLPHLVSDVQLDATTLDSLIGWADLMWPQAVPTAGSAPPGTTLFDAYRQ